MKPRETFQRSVGEMSQKGIWSKAYNMEQDGDQVEVLAPPSRSCEVSEALLVPLDKRMAAGHTPEFCNRYMKQCTRHI